MTKDELSAVLRDEIATIRARDELANARAQLYARRLGARIVTRISEENLWKFLTRIITNGTLLVALTDGRDDQQISSAFKDAAFLLELLSDTAEASDRKFARILSALSYDLAGYQANALCLMRDFGDYNLEDIIHDGAPDERIPHPANVLIPFVRLFLEKRIPAALGLSIDSPHLFVKHVGVALRQWNLHILRGQPDTFVESLSSAYEKSFYQKDYLTNLFLSLLVTRARYYHQRSLWGVLGTVGKDLSGIWGRYVRLKTSDLYQRNRTKPLEARQSRFELWESQLAAVRAGVLSSQDSFAVQMPTSAGKTLIGELVALDALTSRNEAKCLYIAPFRALANQVEADLRDAFSSLGFSVSTLSGSFELDPFDDFVISETDVLVSTPEKVDVLTRLRPDYFRNLAAVIIDEGHLLGELERGPQLELLVTRLRRRFPSLRVVLISAVMPEQNGKEISLWLSGSDNKLIQAPKQEDGKPWQPTQKVFGLFAWDGDVGEITYPEVTVGHNPDGTAQKAFARGLADKKTVTYFTKKRRTVKTRLFPSKASEKGETAALIGYEFAHKGPTLIFTPRPGWVLSAASKLLDLIQGLEAGGQSVHDCFSEKTDLSAFQPAIEWYGEHSLEYRLLKRGIGFHHGQLPDSLRRAIEDDYRDNRIKILFANSTVGQGVNFPIKYLIIHSLVLRSEENLTQRISKRDFWNLAGRAGRAGKETEGQIIFVATTASDRALYQSFINQGAIEPVESVFAQLTRLLVEQRISQDVFSNYVRMFAEPSLLAMLVEEAVGTTDEALVESLINQSLFKTQMLSQPTLAPGIEFIRSTLNSVPARFRSAVQDEAMRNAFARTGFTLDSNLAIQQFVSNAASELSANVASSDTTAFIHQCVSFFLDSEIAEVSFDGVEHFRIIPDAERLAVVDAWITGEPIARILSGSVTESVASPIPPERFQLLLSQGLTFRYPWAISAVLQILAATTSVPFDELPEAIRLAPTFLKYGVDQKIAALLIGIGIQSRQLALKLGRTAGTTDLKAAIEWLRNISIEELSSAGLTDREISDTISIAHNLSRSRHEGNEWPFEVKGTTYSSSRKEAARLIEVGSELTLLREPENEFDPFAIKVVWDGKELGYVPRTTARILAPVIDLQEGQLIARVTRKTPLYDWAKIAAVARLQR